jgi:hypothetical protein
VRLDKGSKYETVSQVGIEGSDLLRMHWVDLSVVIGHPFEQHGFRHTVYITLGHVGLNSGVSWRHARQVLEALGSYSVEIVDLQDLVENGEP